MLKSGHGTEPSQRGELPPVLDEERPGKPQGIDRDALEAFLRPWHNQHPPSSHEQVVRSGQRMTARGCVNRQAGRVKQFPVAGMQGSAAVLFRIGPVSIHWRIGMAERQARYGTDHAVRLSEAQEWLDG